MGSVSVTFQFDTAEQAAAFLSGKPSPEKEAPKPSKSSAKSEAAGAPTPPTAAQAPAAPAAKVRSYNDTGLGDLINSCVKAGKLDAAKEILKSFGVAKGPELKPEQFDDAIAKFKALAAEQTADLG